MGPPLQSLKLAIGFLTRIPTRTGHVEARDLARSLVFFPWVGAALGAAVWGLARLLQNAVAPAIVATLLVATLASVTGALHLDGVADVFDGLGGGRGDKERTLAIMRDSRIGAHGACALFLVLAGKIFAVAELLHAGRLWPLVLAPMVARLTAVGLMVFFPYARAQGLGSGFRDAAGAAHVACASALALPLCAWWGWQTTLPCAATLLTGLGLALFMQRILGGLTGDVYGAAIELGEVACLVVAGAS